MDSLPSPANVISAAGAVVASSAASAAASASDAKVASNLASAAGLGDAQYFEESISPSSIRSSLSSVDPSNPSSMPALLKGMKWLLACMSKGRDVSDFFPHVVKLVGAPNLEARKMVYLYLVRYSDHDPTCRELALLSINSFQRGLADGEPLIRALALRVLTSVEVRDVLQIQILAVRRCAADSSPYVRKCAANALARLGPRCGGSRSGASLHREELVEITTRLLEDDASTMVLTSAVVAFSELCPDRLELLHLCYRKICHLLTDMDEWGQVVVLDVLSRYCRRYFREPSARGSGGSAEAVDRERRVRRTTAGICAQTSASGRAVGAGGSGGNAGGGGSESDAGAGDAPGDSGAKAAAAAGGGLLPERKAGASRARAKRRVVKKAFYSDEEDESEYEDVHDDDDGGASAGVGNVIVRRDIFGFGGTGTGAGGGSGPAGAVVVGSAAGLLTRGSDSEDADLDDDHRLLLRSSLPLLKSRNSAVVLGVASLHYYCGVASVPIRSAMGKALVRIYRGRREIQYVVLTCVKMLARDCPSAFAPFLEDFFVKAMDPSFTRLTKLDILTSLTLDPPSIKSVLTELRSYVRHDDAEFVRASVRAVGKIAELARIVHDRRGIKTDGVAASRRDADLIALNCLNGLLTLAESSTDVGTVGECVLVMERILLMLRSDRAGTLEGRAGGGETVPVHDPHGVRGAVLRRLLLLLVRALATRGPEGEEAEEESEEDGDKGEDERMVVLKERTVALPPPAMASALWIAGEWLCSASGGGSGAVTMEVDGTSEREKAHMRSELFRLVARAFPGLESIEKLQAINLASKALLLSNEGRAHHRHRAEDDASISELILSMGRSDVDTDVRDRARFESRVLHAALEGGLKFDADGFLGADGGGGGGRGMAIGIAQARQTLWCPKPPPSYLPVDETDPSSREEESFRFGTLSSLVSARAGRTYLPLPPWADKDSPSTLRDPAAAPAPSTTSAGSNPKRVGDGRMAEKGGDTKKGFYDSSEESSTSSSSDGSSTSGSDESDSSDEESDCSDEESGSDDESESGSDEDSSEEESDEGAAPAVVKQGEMAASDLDVLMNGGSARALPIAAPPAPIRVKEVASDSDDDSSSDESSSDDDDDSSNSSENISSSATAPATVGAVGRLLPVGMSTAGSSATPAKPSLMEKQISSASSVADDLQGLVMAPLVVDSEDVGGSLGEADEEKESSIWTVLVRPELGGGLLAKSRYLRGKSLQREAKSLGLDPELTAVVCLRIRFENMRTDAGVLRRIRVVQRSGTGGSVTVAPSRFVAPPEVGALKKGQSASIVLGLSFPQSSDKDGSLQVKFEVKSDRGSYQAEVKPPLGELLRPCRLDKPEFESEMSKLQGIHQRTKASFSLPSDEKTPKRELWENFPARIIKYVNLMPVGQRGWGKDNVCAFAGKLPVSGSNIYVVISCSPETGSGDFLVCCDNTMAVNGVMDLLKRAALFDDKE